MPKQKVPTMKLKLLAPDNFHMSEYNQLTACIACETMSILVAKDLTIPLHQKEAFKIYQGGEGIVS